MIELHLIGYTEDAAYLVLDLEVDGEGRYAVPVDPDLLATVEAVRDARLEAGLAVDHRPDPPSPDPTTAVAGNGRADAAVADAPDPADASGSAGAAGPPVADGVAGDEAPAAVEGEAPVPAEEGSGPPAAAPVASGSRLSPAQIQARLRAGQSVRVVAKEAGTDPAWVERWLAPIVAERERVLADARSRRIDRPRARPLGASVERSLTDRGVPPTSARWRVSRREDGRWRITVRFEERGRPRSATWLLDPDHPTLRPQSPLATELARPRRGAGDG